MAIGTQNVFALGRSAIFSVLVTRVLESQACCSCYNPFTLKFKKYILPTFKRELYK